MAEFLFNGKIEWGRLSNQEQIIENVPEEFVEGNVWYDHIKILSETGGPVFNIGWRRRYEYNETTWYHLLHCFQAMYGLEGVEPEKWVPACAWMLSIMLEEVPEPPEVPHDTEDHFYG